MKPDTLKLSVPNPCYEKWDAMTPQSDGRFCESCQTCVKDFIRFTDQQLIEYFQQASGRTCGRFANDQLDRIIASTEYSSRRRFLPQALFGALLTFASSSFAMVKIKVAQTVQMMKAESEANEDNYMVHPDSAQCITGIVIDENGEGVPFASLMLDGTKVGTTTDMDGNFKLQIPEALWNDSYSLVTSYLGYFTNKTLILRNDLFRSQTIKLSPQERSLSGEVVITMGKVPLIQHKEKKTGHRKK